MLLMFECVAHRESDTRPPGSRQHEQQNEDEQHKADAVNQKDVPFDAELTDGGIVTHGGVLAFQTFAD